MTSLSYQYVDTVHKVCCAMHLKLQHKMSLLFWPHPGGYQHFHDMQIKQTSMPVLENHCEGCYSSRNMAHGVPSSDNLGYLCWTECTVPEEMTRLSLTCIKSTTLKNKYCRETQTEGQNNNATSLLRLRYSHSDRCKIIGMCQT